MKRRRGKIKPELKVIGFGIVSWMDAQISLRGDKETMTEPLPIQYSYGVIHWNPKNEKVLVVHNNCDGEVDYLSVPLGMVMKVELVVKIKECDVSRLFR